MKFIALKERGFKPILRPLKLFDAIGEIVGKPNLAKLLIEKLNQTPSCVYRKLKLERLLSIDEVILLAKGFQHFT